MVASEVLVVSAALAAMAVNRPARVTWVRVDAAVKVVAAGSAAMVAPARTAATPPTERLEDLMDGPAEPEVLAA